MVLARSSQRLITLAPAVALLLLAGSAAAQVSRTVVAYRGQQAAGFGPGINYGVFTNNTPPYLDDLGNLAFTSGLTTLASTENDIVFYGSPTSPQVVTQEGGILGDASDFLNLTNTGALIFQAPFVGATSATDGALFTWSAGQLPSDFAREGSAPAVIETGQPADLTYATLTSVPRIAQNGHAFFTGTYAGTGITSSNNSFIAMGPPALARRVVQASQPAPVPGVANATFTELASTPQANAQGALVLTATVVGTGITSANDTAIFAAIPTGQPAPAPAFALSQLARRGQPAPGTGAGITYNGNFDAFLARTLDRAGNFAFLQIVAGTGITAANNLVVFDGSITDPATVTKAFQEGDPVPGVAGDVRWANFVNVTFDGAGSNPADSRLWIRATFRGTSVTLADDTAIVVRNPDDSVDIVVREGDPAPGVPDAVYSSITTLVVNSAGTIVYSAGLMGPGITTSNDTALFIKPLGQPAQLLQQEGEVVELAPGVFRTVSAFTVRGSNAGQTSGDIGLNSNNQVAARVTFTDITDGIFFYELATGVSCDDVDFNNDGVFPDDQDLADFIFVLGGGTCPACNDVDFNNDAVFPDDADLATFLFVLGGGAC